MGQPKKVVLPEMRLSYINLFTPRAIQEGDEPKYSVSILIPKKDKATVKMINDAVAQVIEDNQDKLKAKKGIKHPLRDGDTERENPEYADHWFIGASSKQKPIVVDKDRQEIIETREVYSGMYGRVSFNLFAFNTAGNKGIAAGLNAVQKTRDGESLGGAYTESEMKDDFSEEVNTEGDDLM